MFIVGFKNVVSKNGNKGVNVCVTGEWSDWDKEHGETKGNKVEMVYVSKKHLEETDIGRQVYLVYSKYDNKVYVKDIIF